MRRLHLLLAAGLIGCSGAEVVDAGAPDAAPTDAGIVDAAPAPRDAGFVDAEVLDAAPTDVGFPDAGEPALGPVTVDVEAARPPELLSGYAFLRWRDGGIEYNERVVPYALSVPLFTDYAMKSRAIWVPEGTQIEYRETGPLEFPVGSAIIKSFLFAEDMRDPQVTLRPVETRVLVRYADGWRAYPYVWNEDGTDAEYFVRGRVEALDFVDPFGNPRTAQYLVPQKNQCILCHEIKDEAGERYTTLIGPRARYLNRLADYGGPAPENQLQHLADLGMLSGLPQLQTVPSAYAWSTLSETGTTGLAAGALDRAARDYLDINCAHCHRPDATQGMTSRLWLNWDNEDEFNLGFCKEPGSAGAGTGGRRYDIVPGDAESSILIFRTETELVGSMMPLLGRSLKDDLAIGVLRGWVDSLPPDDCEN